MAVDRRASRRGGLDTERLAERSPVVHDEPLVAVARRLAWTAAVIVAVVIGLQLTRWVPREVGAGHRPTFVVREELGDRAQPDPNWLFIYVLTPVKDRINALVG